MMKRLLIAGILAVVACSSPTEPTEPEPEVVFAADFESGQLPAWEYCDCKPSIENDGDYYLLVVAEPSAEGLFGFFNRSSHTRIALPKFLGVSFRYKTANIDNYGKVSFTPDGYTGISSNPSNSWRKVTAELQFEYDRRWPRWYSVYVRGYYEQLPGMSLAVDDIVVTAYY